jgi:hypothetical protein
MESEKTENNSTTLENPEISESIPDSEENHASDIHASAKHYTDWSTEQTEVEKVFCKLWEETNPLFRWVFVSLIVIAIATLIIAGVISISGW